MLTGDFNQDVEFQTHTEVEWRQRMQKLADTLLSPLRLEERLTQEQLAQRHYWEKVCAAASARAGFAPKLSETKDFRFVSSRNVSGARGPHRGLTDLT